jgi:glutathione S-transferase
MAWVQLVLVLALLQYLMFGMLVGMARERFGVKAPAITGHEGFERLYRVQMNTLELLLPFVPALWLAAQYRSPMQVAGVGLVYLVGRMIYWRSYVRDPASRTLGFGLSFFPIIVLLLAAGWGAAQQAWATLG